MFEHGFPKHWSTLKKLIYLKGAGIIGGASAVWKTVTGTLIHVLDALASPMQKCEVTLEPIQAGSGDPSPTNVRPITGWTGCEVTVNGSNLFDGVVTNGRINDGKYTSSGSYRCSDYIKVNGGENIICSADDYYFYSFISEYDSEKSFIKTTQSYANVQLTANTKYIRVYWQSAAWTATDGKIIISIGTNHVPYKQYQGTTLSVTFPDTVYGGKYDFVSGGLKPYKEYDSYNGETLTGEWMSSMDKYVAGTTPTIGAQVVDLDGYDTTVQLTPQEISTLKRENNVWSNGDSVEITYKAQGE